MFTNRNQPEQPPSPCGIAFDQRNGTVVVAEYSPEGGFDVDRTILGQRRSVNLTSTDLRTTLTNSNAHTNSPPFPVSADATEEAILQTLVAKSQGDQSHVIAFTRTPDARILVTQVDQVAVSNTIRDIDRWLEQQRPEHIKTAPFTLRAETTTRAITRLWRYSQGDTEPTGTAAVLIITDEEYAVALWSERTGLVYETEEPFEPGAGSNIKCQYARDVFTKFIAPASLTQLKLPPVSNVVLSAAEGYAELMLSLLNDSSELAHIPIEPVYIDINQPTPLDQPAAFAIGSLLDHATVPPCNLTLTPQMRLDEIANERQLVDSSASSKRARAATLAIALPLVSLLAFGIGSSAHNYLETSALNSRIDQESVIAQQLAKENADYESSKSNFATFQTLLDNLIALRNRQPAAHQLLNDLNQRWPQEPTWYISEINVKGATVEIKGKTKNEQAITSFAKSLEFSNGLFTGILTRNNVEGNSGNNAPQQLAQSTRSNVIEFTILSTYTPLSVPAKANTATATLPQNVTAPTHATPTGPQVTTKPASATTAPGSSVPNLPVQ